MNGKKRLSSRILAMVLSVLMILQSFPTTAFAEPEGYYTGSVESNELWLQDEEQMTEAAAGEADVVLPEAETEFATETELEIETEYETETESESEPEEEEETEKLELNQQVFVGGTTNGMAVRVIAPAGAFPEGTKMKLSAVAESEVRDIANEMVGGEAGRIRAVDISFWADGKEVEPTQPVSVFMNAVGMVTENNLKVVHVPDSGSAEVVAETSGTSAEFKSGEFSIYLMAEGPALKAAEGEPELITVTFDPTTDPTEQLTPETIEVEKGNAIGDSLPAVPEIVGYETYWVKSGTEEKVTADTVVEEEFTAVVKQGDKINYTVSFVQEDGTVETRTTNVDNGFAINDLPTVTPKTNQVGKWVYQGTTNEFTVGTVVRENLTVKAYYEQNIFKVEFLVDGNHYEEMTTATGTTIILPSDPVKEGATFKGWFTEEEGKGTQYTAESTVDADLTLYAFFEGQVRVSFIVKDDEGNIISEKSQLFY